MSDVPEDEDGVQPNSQSDDQGSSTSPAPSPPSSRQSGSNSAVGSASPGSDDSFLQGLSPIRARQSQSVLDEDEFLTALDASFKKITAADSATVDSPNTSVIEKSREEQTESSESTLGQQTESSDSTLGRLMGVITGRIATQMRPGGSTISVKLVSAFIEKGGWEQVLKLTLAEALREAFPDATVSCEQPIYWGRKRVDILFEGRDDIDVCIELKAESLFINDHRRLVNEVEKDIRKFRQLRKKYQHCTKIALAVCTSPEAAGAFPTGKYSIRPFTASEESGGWPAWVVWHVE
ncbi:hypothetical protein [Burkholderia ubonensis]|uniref:hypothetical protein n=1 Tax=Burkholderia ubonensis TaxID=101571 RepID=UPI000B2C6CB4|nr:hypothetical protein [Burkholderia ubonensis]